MAHCVSPEAEKILDKEFPVLDKGFVRLVDYLGSDQRIVQSARVSYGEGTKTYRQDKGLINYLMRNDHTSPFEQVVFTFHVKAPIFVARQWVRHRTARMNEISGRYSVMKDETYLPPCDMIALQSEDNKQGRKDEPVDRETAEKIRDCLSRNAEDTFRTYHELLDTGLAVRSLVLVDDALGSSLIEALVGAGRSSLGGVGIALLDGLVNVLNERLELRAHSAVAHTGLLGGADTLLLRFDVSHFAEFLSSS